MFHSPPRPRATRRARSGPRSQELREDIGGAIFRFRRVRPAHPATRTDDTHQCRHARSTGSQATRGRTRPSRRPWRGPRAPVAGVPTCVRSRASRATSARGPTADAAASGCHGTGAGSREGAPAWEFRGGGRREGVTPSATGERHRRPTRATGRVGRFSFVGSLQRGRWRTDQEHAGQVKGGRRARSPKHGERDSLCQGRASRRATHSKGRQHSKGP